MKKKVHSSPLVSVVIPAYNVESLLEQSVESILKQTYQNIEVIIIDDKSTDNTLGVAKRIARRDKRIQVIANKKNLGIGANRNKGIEAAKGAYICWQDADDISAQDRISRQIAVLESNEGVGVVGGFLRFFDKNGDGVVRKYAADDTYLRNHIFRYNPVAQPATMARSSVYQQVGLFDSRLRLSEDLEMLFRIGEKYKFANVQDVVLWYRQSDNSLTRSNLKNMERVTLRLRAQYKKSSAYNYGLIDALYNTVQRILLNVPAGIKIRLFTIVRGDKKV